LEPGIAARLWDPAWMLARQWVLGELDGEDAGTPVSAILEVDHHAVTHASWEGQEIPFDPKAVPLDAMIEGDRIYSASDWALRQRVEAGQTLVRALRSAGFTSLVSELLQIYPLREMNADQVKREPRAAGLQALAVGRVPDGESIYKKARELGHLPILGQQGDPAQILSDWLVDLSSQFCEPPSPPLGGAKGIPPVWDKSRLDYSFSVRCASLSDEFRVLEHRGLRMDWYGFEQIQAGNQATVQPNRQTVTRVPTPIRFGGMPEPRYWTFENANIDLGSVEASSTDLARMAILQFAFAYGNDAFLIPVALPVGAFSRIVSLKVADTFGQTTAILPAMRRQTLDRSAWSFLAISETAGMPGNLLFVPPVADHAQFGVVLEEATLLRDEMANLVWGVERKVEGEDGRPLDRAQALQRETDAPPEALANGPLTYTLQTGVPANWFPIADVPGQPRMMKLVPFDQFSEGPRGRLLPAKGGEIFEEEVPREGVRLCQRYVMARWFNGETFVWRRTERATGRGEGSSGLRFDIAEPS